MNNPQRTKAEIPAGESAKPLRVLVACEFSGIVREAFRKRGHDAWSADPIQSEILGHHANVGVEFVLAMPEYPWGGKWDLMIAFPPCTDLASSGARWFWKKNPPISDRQPKAVQFVEWLWTRKIPRIAIENPIGVLSSKFRKPDQIIQPWQFGHGETKATCLWLKNLPKLKPTNIVEGRVGRVWKEPPSEERWKNRSRTYQGIADAMAEQWGRLPA